MRVPRPPHRPTLISFTATSPPPPHTHTQTTEEQLEHVLDQLNGTNVRLEEEVAQGSALKAQVDELANGLDDANGRAAEAQAANGELSAALQNAEERAAELQEEAAELAMVKKELEARMVQWEGHIRQTWDTEKAQADALDDAESKERDLRAVFEVSEVRREQLQSQHHELSKDKAALEERLQEMERRCHELEVDNAALGEVAAENDGLRQELEEARDVARGQGEELEASVLVESDMKGQLQALSEEKREMMLALEEQESALQSASHLERQQKAALEASDKECARQEGEVRAVNERLVDLQTHASTSVEALEAAQRKVRTQETLLEAAEKHRVEIHERLVGDEMQRRELELKAERYAALQDEHRELETLFGEQEQRLEEALVVNGQYERSLAELEGSNQRLVTDVDQLSGTMKHEVADKDRAQFELRAVKEEGEKQRTALGLQLKDAREEAESSQATVKQLMGEVVDLREEKRDLDESVARLEHRCHVELAQEVAALSAAKGVLEQQSSDQRSELHELSRAKEGLTRDLHDSNARLSTLETEASVKAKAIDALEARVAEQDGALATARVEAEEREAVVHELQGECSELGAVQGAKAALHEEAVELERQLSELREAWEEESAMNDGLKQANNDLEGRVEALEHDLHDSDAARSKVGGRWLVES